MIKNKQQPWSQSDRDKMIWTDFNLAIAGLTGIIIGILLGLML